MSRLQRHGTVTGPAGHTHSNSYAMRGVRLRYKPSIYVPDLLHLPPSWTKPTLPSDQAFNYDYSLEHRIADEAKQRALSVASEASLQRKQILALQQQQHLQVADASNALSGGSSATSQTGPSSLQPPGPIPPFMSGSEILTPTPVAPPPSSMASKVGGVVGSDVQSASGSSQSNSDGSSSSLLGDDDAKKTAADFNSNANPSAATVIKSLGNFSLKEFEGDSTDPFELATLQAINDMEELQSVLQPLLVSDDTTTPPPASTSTLSSCTSQVSSLPGPPPASAATFGLTGGPSHLPPVATVSPLTSNMTVPSFSVAGLSTTSSSSSHLLLTGQSSNSAGPIVKSSSKSTPDLGRGGPVLHKELSSEYSHQMQTSFHHNTTKEHTVTSGPSYIGSTSLSETSAASVANANPFSGGNLYSTGAFTSEAETSHTVVYPVIPPSLDSQQLPSSDSQLVGSNPAITALPVASGDGSTTPPVPAPRKIVAKSSSQSKEALSTSSSASSPLPVPRPRPRSGSPSPSSSPRISSGGIKALPPPPSSSSSPLLTQRHHTNSGTQQANSGTQQAANTKSTPAATSVAPVSVAVYPKPSQVAGVAVLPSLHPQTGQRGVAVLPPLPAQPSSQTEDLPPPPAYKPVSTPPSKRKGSPPPPYSSPSANHRVQPVASALPAYKPLSPPKVAPKPAYILPNPENKLSAAEMAQVKGLESMGFPQPRVARAILRFAGDQTKVLDFLFLVGELEDAGYKGDSAETALVTCEDNTEKAKDYLQKLEMYKEFGFREKAIHEAYSKAKSDWNEALNILTKER